MLESFQPFQITLTVMEYEIMGCLIHGFHQRFTVLYYRHSLAPCESRGKESGNLNILFFGKLMRDRNRVVRNKLRSVVLICLNVEEVLKTPLWERTLWPYLFQKPNLYPAV